MMTLLERVRVRWLKRALKVCKGNRTHAAKYLGISHRTIRLWMIRYGFREPETRKGWYE